MKFEVVWERPFERALHYIHWRTGGVICEAVLEFATFDAASAVPARAHIMRVAGYLVSLRVDHNAKTVTAIEFYR